MKKIFTLCACLLLSMQFNSNAQTVLFENFESATGNALPAGWASNVTSPAGWKTQEGAMTWAIWQLSAHTTYAIVNDYANPANNDSALLISPVFNLTGVTGAMLRYDYFFIGAYVTASTVKFEEKAYVQISTDGGGSWTVLDSLESNDTTWQVGSASLAAYDNMSNLQIAIRYTDKTKNILGAAVDNIRIYVPTANDLALLTVTPTKGTLRAYGSVSAPVNIGGTVTNDGSATVTGFDVKIQEGTSTPVTHTVSGVTIAPYGTYNFNTNALSLPAAMGNNDIKVWVELVGDSEPLNDSGSTAITAVSFMPPKKIFVEEGTGTWCGWCPRGTVYMDSVHNTYPNNFSLVAVHNNDPMKNTTYDNFVSAQIGGYPSILVDRRDVLDPSDLISVYNNQKDNFGFAEITLTDVPANGFNYSIKATVKPGMNLMGDYRLALILTEDDVHGEGSTWGQANYYSGYAPLVGAGFDWMAQPSKVPASLMYYDFVGRAIIPSPTGAAGSLPASMTAGNTYDYTFNTTINPGYNRTKMKAVVILLRNSDGHVLNSNNLVVPVGISDIDAGIDRMNMYPNPTNDNATIRFGLRKNTKVNVDVIDMTGRVVMSIPGADYRQGTHTIDLSASQLAPGLYNVKMQTETGAITQRLSVVK